MKVSVQWCNDTNSSDYGYAFWHNGKRVARCEESDYHQTVQELRHCLRITLKQQPTHQLGCAM